MQIKYRIANKNDSQEINNLFIEMIKTVNARMEKEGIEPYTDLLKGYEDGYLDEFYINEDKIVFVAEDNDKVVGFLSVCMYKKKNYIYLDDYCVNSNYRGYGIGTKLMNMSIDYANKFNIKNIRTHVESANHESIIFYENKGFRVVEKEKSRILINKELI